MPKYDIQLIIALGFCTVSALAGFVKKEADTDTPPPHRKKRREEKKKKTERDSSTTYIVVPL